MEGLCAIVLCGGKGTRMRSARPKSIHRLLGLPLSAWPIRCALGIGAAPVVVVVSERSGAVEQELRAAFPEDDLRFAWQERPLGTADAVLAGRDASAGSDAVLIVYGDVPLLRRETLSRLSLAYRDSGQALALVTCELSDGAHYGRALRDETGELVALREAKDASDEERRIGEVNVGVYLCRRELLFAGLERLDSENAQGELYLTDLVEILVGDGRRVGTVRIDDPSEMLGVNSREELARACEVLRSRVNGRWMNDGVTLTDPLHTWIEPDVVIGPDTVVETGAVLRGRTCIGARGLVGPGAVLDWATLGDDVVVGARAVLEGVRVPSGMSIPPLSHLTR